MSIDLTFSLIAVLVTIGILQSSIEQLQLLVKFPAIFRFPLDKGIVKSTVAKRLAFAYNSPFVQLLLVLRALFASTFLISIYFNEVQFLWPLGLIIIDVLGFIRWKFMPSSDIPLQRVILISLTLHYYFDSSEISLFVLIAISGFLSLAYFAAGLKKIQSSNWKEGIVMSNIAFEDALPFSRNKRTWRRIGYLVVLFECSFFTSLINSWVALVFLITGFIFHFYFYLKHKFSFFFWTFVASYPAFYYIAKKIELWLNI